MEILPTSSEYEGLLAARRRSRRQEEAHLSNLGVLVKAWCFASELGPGNADDETLIRKVDTSDT